MYFWKIKPLAKELGLGLISEKKSMHYLLVSSLLILFSTYLSLMYDVIRDWMFYYEIILLSIITVIGCLVAFESNGNDEGLEFVKHFICLSVPIGVQVNTLGIIFGLMLSFWSVQIFDAISFGDPVRAYTIVRYAGFIGLHIYFWWLLIQGFKQVRLYEIKSNE